MHPMQSTLVTMSSRLPSLKTVALCISLLTFYHLVMVFMYHQLHETMSPSHALLNSERLEFISTHLRQMYRLKNSIEKDPSQRRSIALQILLDNLRALEEVVSPWDLSDMKHERQAREKFPKPMNELEVCPESYLGPSYGEPLFEKGFETAKCDGAPVIRSLLTVLLNFHQNEKDFRKFGLDIISSVSEVHPGIPVIVAVPRGTNLYDLDVKARQSVSFLQVVESRNHGDVWNDLINNAKTKYVFVGRGLTDFQRDTNFERLIREMGSLGLAFVGGATLSSEGLWSLSCHQTYHRNYKLFYKNGYEHSEHGCVFCDVISAPFIAQTRILRSRAFDRNLVGQSAFEDLFLRLKRARIKAAVCPDVMFHVSSNIFPSNRALWMPFAYKWRINILSFSNKPKIEFTCPELKTVCKAEKFSDGKNVPPCCLRTLSQTVQTVMRKCETVGIECELQGSVLLGAVKIKKVLPWERSASISFLSSNYTAMDDLKKALIEDGLNLVKEQNTFCCTEGQRDGGQYGVVGTSPGLAIKMVGQYRLTSDSMRKHHPYTRVNQDGHWLRAPRNPGLHLRNRYGLEIMRHKEGRVLPDGSTMPTAGFTTCRNIDNHDCLDQYAPDGSLQFDEC